MESWLDFVTPRKRFVSNSESIFEAEEVDKIEVLQNAGKSALGDGDGTLALHLYSEALEIDGANVESLCGHCLALLLTGEIDQARQDAASVIRVAAENPRGYYLEALCLEHENKYEDSLKVFLRAFELRNADERIISDRILSVAQKCLGNESFIQPADLQGINGDGFETLSEAGRILLAAEKPDLAVDVLSAATKCDVKRTEAEVAKQRLLIGQAFASSENLDAAVSSFQDCLKSCNLCEDSSMMRVEALSRLAGVYTRVSDPLHAIMCYENLLELVNGSEELPTRTSVGSAFLCGIHLNLSIAYRSLSRVELARHHAQLAHSVSKAELQSPLQSEVQLNLGILATAMGDYQEAATQFEDYRKLCKHTHDENGLITSYGCLGNVYAHLRCCNLATAYHDRQVTLGRNLRDRSAMALAKEMEGDSFVLLHRYSAAIRSYQQLLWICKDGLILSTVGTYFKLGRAFLLDKKDRHARLCFEKALSMYSGSGLNQLITQIELSLASILIDADDQDDLESAKSIYRRLIQRLEHDLSLQSESLLSSHVRDLKMRLKECYRGLVCIFSKMDNERDALVHVERLNLLISDCKPTLEVQKFNIEEDVINKLTSVVDNLNCSVIYYLLLPKVLLIWILSRGGKIFHVKKVFDENCTDVVTEVDLLIKSAFSYLSTKELIYSCENRALPLKESGHRGKQDLGRERLVNQRLKVANCNECDCGDEGSIFEASEDPNNVCMSDITSCSKNNVECKSQGVSSVLEASSAEQRLYGLLVVPVETFLQNECVEDNHIVIVPCEVLSRCPFWSLCSKDGVPLGKKYHITVTGSLSHLNATRAKDSGRASHIGLNHGCANDVQEDLRTDSCGSFSNHSMSCIPTPRCDDGEKINPKCTSNPRLAVLNGCCAASSSLKQRKGQSDVTPMNSSSGVIRPEDAMGAVQDKLENTSSSAPSQKQKFVVIGSPSLPKCVMLDGRQSTLFIEEGRMQTECIAVADLLGADCIIGSEATTDRFLEELKSATILHIATLFSPEFGNLAMSPNPVPDLYQQTLVDEALYLVRADEIMATVTSAKLVVVSGGWSIVSQRGLSASQALVSAFLSAGACCVLGVMFPVPSEVLLCFYEGFYRALPSVGGQLSIAFRLAIDHVNLNERFKDDRFSSAFALFGIDATVDMMSVTKSVILHSITQAKDLCEKDAELTTSSGDAIHLEINVNKIQKFLSSLILTISDESELLHHLIELLKVASASSCADEPFQTSTILHDDLCKNVAAIKLLKILGFTFQPPEGVNISKPYILVPCSDPDGLLCICLEALYSLKELSSDHKCLMAIQHLLPVTPSLAGDLSNLLNYFVSDPNGEVKTSDQGDHSFFFWKDTKIRTLLTCIGLHCLDHHLYFRNTTKNRNLLHEMCRLLKLFVPSSVPPNDLTNHPSVPCLGSTWATEVESSVKMKKKIQLSSRVKEENDQLRSSLNRAVMWHKTASAAQGRDILQRKSSKPFFTRSLKVKVHGGSTPSQTRVPVDNEVIVDLRQMEERRDYAHFIYKRRLDHVKTRHQGTVSNLMLPHIFQ